MKLFNTNKSQSMFDNLKLNEMDFTLTPDTFAKIKRQISSWASVTMPVPLFVARPPDAEEE